MALEDAVTLAECLDRATATSDVPLMLHAFQDIRQPRCKRVQEWGARKGARAILPDGLEQEKRDRNFALYNAWINADPWDQVHINELPELESGNWKAWLKGHDAVYFVSWCFFFFFSLNIHPSCFFLFWLGGVEIQSKAAQRDLIPVSGYQPPGKRSNPEYRQDWLTKCVTANFSFWSPQANSVLDKKFGRRRS